MLNQIVLVGRIAENLELGKEENKNSTYIKLNIPRSFKNKNGEYETDVIDVKLFDAIATSVVENCKVGDVVGVKGRIQGNNKKMEIVADRLTFLSSNKGC